MFLYTFCKLCVDKICVKSLKFLIKKLSFWINSIFFMLLRKTCTKLDVNNYENMKKNIFFGIAGFCRWWSWISRMILMMAEDLSEKNCGNNWEKQRKKRNCFQNWEHFAIFSSSGVFSIVVDTLLSEYLKKKPVLAKTSGFPTICHVFFSLLTCFHDISRFCGLFRESSEKIVDLPLIDLDTERYWNVTWKTVVRIYVRIEMLFISRLFNTIIKTITFNKINGLCFGFSKFYKLILDN